MLGNFSKFTNMLLTPPDIQSRRASLVSLHMLSHEQTRWVSVVGARPQFVKLAALCRAIEKHNSTKFPLIQHRIVHTGQHYDSDMTDAFFAELNIPEPAYNLGVHSCCFGQQVGQMLELLEPVITSERPDWLLVYGDTNSTLSGALVGARLGIPVAHVEAGCRSYRASMPEEQNRVLTDHLSRLLLVPTEKAADNLRREGIGIPDDPLHRRIAWVGDTMLDALQASIDTAEQHSTKLQALGLNDREYYLLTLHRAENTVKPEALERVLDALATLSLPLIFPVHPRTRKVLSAATNLQNSSNLRVISPLSYLEMLILEKHAKAILTDSGGVQKEAFYLQVPCVTLREETEWPETIAVGANHLAGTHPERILSALRLPFPDLSACRQPFGVGDASNKTVDEILALSSVSIQLPATSSATWTVGSPGERVTP